MKREQAGMPRRSGGGATPARQGRMHRVHRHFNRDFLPLQLEHLGLAVGLLALSLVLGMWGYEHFEQLAWRDAFLNSAMLLAGMGPVKTDLSEAGKLFAGIYALYAGLVVIAVMGLLLSPGVHALMHLVHWYDPQNEPVDKSR